MKNKRKFAFAVLAATAVTLSCSASVLAEIPNAYWQYQDPLLQAFESSNHTEVIRLGKEVIQVFQSLPDTDQNKKEIMFNTYEKLYPAYEALGDYENAMASLESFIQYGENLGFADAVKLAKMRIKKIDPMTQVYALTQNTTSIPYFGMKHEAKNGTYFGRVHSSSGQAPFSDESAISFYAECLTENISSYDYLIRPQDNGTKLIHIALNMPNENTTLSQVLETSSDAYLDSTMEYLNTLKGPVLLRIGAEMNVWQNAAQPELYKQAYIKIANKARQLAPNVALVFSPNDISSWNTDIADYYPGDTYVDWVGVSLYTNQFKNASVPAAGSDSDEMYYGNGIYANPIAKLRDIVERYGDKKPIIITECGVGHTIPSADLSSFAKSRLNTLYTYVNMVYPQVKAILYFDTEISDTGFRYTLSSNPAMMAQYQSSTGQNKSLIRSGSSASLAYVKAGTYQDQLPEIQLNAYCALPGDLNVTVEYYLDQGLLSSSAQIPYPCSLKADTIADGNHELKVVFQGENGYQKTKTYTLIKSGSSVTITEL